MLDQLDTDHAPISLIGLTVGPFCWLSLFQRSNLPPTPLAPAPFYTEPKRWRGGRQVKRQTSTNDPAMSWVNESMNANTNANTGTSMEMNVFGNNSLSK